MNLLLKWKRHDEVMGMENTMSATEGAVSEPARCYRTATAHKASSIIPVTQNLYKTVLAR